MLIIYSISNNIVTFQKLKILFHDIVAVLKKYQYLENIDQFVEIKKYLDSHDEINTMESKDYQDKIKDLSLRT